MTPFAIAVLAIFAAAGTGVLVLACFMRQAALLHRLRLLSEQTLASARGEAEATRAALRAGATETAERIAALRGGLDTGLEQVRAVLSREQGELRLALADAQHKAA